MGDLRKRVAEMLMLKEARMRKGLEQKQIADKFGLSVSTISLYETGKREPAFDTLVKFADFFGVTTDYLLGRVVKDPYSQRFREHVEFELQVTDPADMEAWAESGGKLNGAVYEDFPLTLADACEIANEMGLSLSELMGEEEEDYLSFLKKIDPDVTKTPTITTSPEESTAPEESAPMEMEKLLESLTPGQTEFLLAVMRRMLEPVKAYVK